MSDHAKFVATAQRLIAKHGRNVTFKVVSSVETDSTRPWRGTATAPATLGPFKAAFVPFRGYEFGSDYVDSGLFKETTEICLVAGGQADLEVAHLLTDSGKDYKIEWIQRLKPGDQTVLYAMGVDR